MNTPTDSEILERWRASRARAGGGPYYAMYSSWARCIVTDPALMLVPVDDHLVHRGDGVFETLKCHRGALYRLRAHLKRLQHSAKTIALKLPLPVADLEHLIVQTVRAGGQPDALVRVLVSRGPGGFGVNPKESSETGLYIVVYPSAPPFMQARPEGARAALTTIPAKPPPLLSVKTCNYLPNALMKLEAIQRGLDFVVCRNWDGTISESFTENLFIINEHDELIVPPGESMLAGTTLQRVLELKERLHGRCVITIVRPLWPEEVDDAMEVMIAGTTTHVTAVVEWEGRPVGDGKPGPIHAQLSALFEQDILYNASERTTIFT